MILFVGKIHQNNSNIHLISIQSTTTQKPRDEEVNKMLLLQQISNLIRTS